MIELIRKRRSIRKFTEQKIEEGKVALLKETLLRSPTSRNLYPWEFVVVDDRETIRALSKAKPHGLGFLEEAALAVVICGDETKSDVWIEDCSIASIMLQLTAQSLGLGSCWGQIRLRQYDESKSSEHFVQELLSIPEHIHVESIIGIGYPAENRNPVLESELLTDKIHYNRF